MNSSSSKQDILANIRSANKGIPSETGKSRDAKIKPSPASSKEDQIIEKFTQMLQIAGGECHVLENDKALKAKLEEILSDFSKKQILIGNDSELKEIGLPQLIEEITGKAIFPDKTQLNQSASADLGITTAQAGIADTGTAVLAHTSERGRLAALLPPVHLAILKKDLLFANKFSYLKAARSENTDLSDTPMTWVTGPSLTADIEKVLVRGAHGPRRVIVILY